jgi:8-oxo-dGTP pyrophosphatase MutT (NUDIX family)
MEHFSESTYIEIRGHRRKVFKYCDNWVSASGILFYKIINNECYLLLIKYNDLKCDRYDDFGGCIDQCDQSIYDAMIRECQEETNGVINKYIIDKYLQKDYDLHHNKYSRYLGFLKQVDNDFFPDTSVFGNLEIHDNLKRIVQWIKYSKDINLPYRLKDTVNFFDTLIKID